MIRETFRDHSQIRIRDKKINPDGWKGMLWLPVNVSSLNLSLFLAFPLHSNVDTARDCFVVQNWRVLPQNGKLLEELSSWIEESLQDDMIGEKSKRKSLLDYFLCTLNSEEEKRAKTQSSTLSKILNEEFRVYRKLATEFVSSSFDSYDPIKFWKQNKYLLPNLTLLAQKYSASPSISTKSESAFSISSYYGRKQRNQISSENLGFSVFLEDKLSDWYQQWFYHCPVWKLILRFLEASLIAFRCLDGVESIFFLYLWGSIEIVKILTESVTNCFPLSAILWMGSSPTLSVP